MILLAKGLVFKTVSSTVDSSEGLNLIFLFYEEKPRFIFEIHYQSFLKVSAL